VQEAAYRAPRAAALPGSVVYPEISSAYVLLAKGRRQRSRRMLLAKYQTSIPFPAWKADLFGFLVSQRLK